MVGTSMPCTETIDGWIPGIDAQPWTPKEEINAPPPNNPTTRSPAHPTITQAGLTVGCWIVGGSGIIAPRAHDVEKT